MPRSASLLALCAAIALPAQASAPAAWDAHYREVATRCLAASGLRDARAEGRPMLFSDDVGTALLMRGKARSSGKTELRLCMFRRGSGRVEVRGVSDGAEPSG